MRIALIGYGKMGKLIEEIALAKGHYITLRINSTNTNEFADEHLKDVDVAIEFTNPHSAYDNVQKCLTAGVPVICGSTGWNDNMEVIKTRVKEKGGAFLHASNFSVGVNIFFQVNKLLAQLLSAQETYTASIKEIHHTQKKDAPSGTAVTLAEQIISKHSQIKSWSNDESKNSSTLFIQSKRVDPAPGTHHVKYTSAIDDIEIVHTAHNRNGFAAGAVLAAEFIMGKSGVFSMDDVLQFSTASDKVNT